MIEKIDLKEINTASDILEVFYGVRSIAEKLNEVIDSINVSTSGVFDEKSLKELREHFMADVESPTIQEKDK